MRIAEVVVDVSTSQIDKAFDYAIPEGLAQVDVGWRVRVPFGPQKLEGVVVAVKDHTDVPRGRLKPIDGTLEDYGAILPEMVDLALWLKNRCHCFLADALRQMMPAQMRGGRISAKTERFVALKVSPEEAGRAMGEMARAPRQIAALNALLAFGGQAEVGVLNRESGMDSAVWRALEKKGLVELTDQETWRRPAGTYDVGGDLPKTPDTFQRRAIDTICENLGQGGVFLLHGVTGCGKTEVYMQCASQALARGQGVIILVPEIALTPQMVRRFVARFGDRAAVLHSRLSAGERYDEWRRIRQGEAHVVVGARSAIFAPIENLGLIVIDEEHEQSYKSEHNPRYDAADVARERGRRSQAPVVLGSATPALTSYWAAQQGEYTLIEMPKRIENRPLPEVEIVDMRRELVSGNRGVMSAALCDKLEETLNRGEQAILMLNRRGYSTFVSCRACGEVVTCDLCDVAMTWHKSYDHMKCHYCGETAQLPTQCPKCGSKYIRFFGDGTQKLEEELHERFPGARMLRMDADTTREKNSHMLLLDSFRRREADVLIGTQMIAKGLDFPYVTLVGVVAVDAMLFMPDYRSSERAYQLMAQVAGRAGRAQRPGYVVLQTYAPDNMAVRCAAAHAYRAFYDREIEDRAHSLYPPFGSMLRVLVSHEDKGTAYADVQVLGKALNDYIAGDEGLKQAVRFTQITAAPISRIQARYRFQFVAKVGAGEAAQTLEARAAAIRELPGGSYVTVEVDPNSML